MPILTGRYKRNAQGAYNPWGEGSDNPTSHAYANYLTNVGGLSGINRNPGSYVSEGQFAQNHRDSGGDYAGPPPNQYEMQSAMKGTGVRQRSSGGGGRRSRGGYGVSRRGAGYRGISRRGERRTSYRSPTGTAPGGVKPPAFKFGGSGSGFSGGGTHNAFGVPYSTPSAGSNASSRFNSYIQNLRY